MTKEEAYNVLLKLRAWRAWGKGEQDEEERPEIPLQNEVDEALDVFIETLKPAQIEGLDEAAVKYANRCAKDGIDHELIKQHFKAGAEWAFGQFESMGTFPVEDVRGGYWPTEYFIRKK